jgi:hypothetical protein
MRNPPAEAFEPIEGGLFDHGFGEAGGHRRIVSLGIVV